MEIYKPQIFDFETKNHFFEKLETYLIDKILDTNAQEGVVRVALSCGQASLDLYQRLPKNIGIPWDRVFFYQTDEISPNNQQPSFQEQIKSILGQSFLREIGEVNFFNLNYPTDMMIKDYQDYLENLDGILFDITILEIRSDGSFAGIFSNGKHLNDLKKPVLEVFTPENYTEKNRATLNIQTILNSDEILVLNYGENNKNVLRELLEGNQPASQFPARMLLAHPKLKIFQFID